MRFSTACSHHPWFLGLGSQVRPVGRWSLVRCGPWTTDPGWTKTQARSTRTDGYTELQTALEAAKRLAFDTRLLTLYVQRTATVPCLSSRASRPPRSC